MGPFGLRGSKCPFELDDDVSVDRGSAIDQSVTLVRAVVAGCTDSVVLFFNGTVCEFRFDRRCGGDYI